ncbi:MAG TPA: hypothetical protein VF585_10290 [Chthoniobacterales bacterium]|jgi:hypothetical protein
MIKYCSLFLLTCAVLLQPIVAADFNIPEEDSIAKITIPDDWKSEEFDGGVESNSEDGSVYLAVEATESTTAAAAMEEAFAYLKKKGVTVDEKSAKQEELKLNGFDVVDISWDGKDEDGPCKVSVAVIAITEDKGLLLTYWTTPEGEKENLKEIQSITNSIKKAE